jgi:hypothetical protein
MKKRELRKKNNYRDYGIVDVRYKELVEAGISYSEENKPTTEEEKADAILLLIGPARYKHVLRILDESGDDSINFADVLKVAEEMEVEKAKTKTLLKEITELEVNRTDVKTEGEKND